METPPPSEGLAFFSWSTNSHDAVLDPTIFRQADFIERAISNINSAMLQGGILVIVVLILFLFSWRAGVISFTAIPLSLLAAIIVLENMWAAASIR